MGPSTPSPTNKCFPPPPTWVLGVSHACLRERVWRDPIQTKGQAFWYYIYTYYNPSTCISRGGRKVRLIDLPIPIRSSDFIGRYNRLMSSSDFCIGRLCRFVLSSDSLIVRSCFLVLSSDFCIVRLCRPVLSKKLLFFDTLFVDNLISFSL